MKSTHFSPQEIKSDQPFTESGHDLRVILISDLHTEWLRISPRRLATALTACQADVILFAGDVTNSPDRLPDSRAWLEVIRNQAKHMGIPLLAVPGNHDQPDTIQLLVQEEFTVLQNNSTIITNRNGIPWAVIGLTDLRKGLPDLATALTHTHSSGNQTRLNVHSNKIDNGSGDIGVSPANQSRLDVHSIPPTRLDVHSIPPTRRVVLSHNPDNLLQQNANQATFFLAGHFHGGQIWMPFHLEFYLLRREQIGRMGYHRGYFIWQNMYGYITQGLGCVLFPLRLFSRPEIAVLTLQAPTKN